ncbi:MAG: DUF4250 domain-containing protein [Lachnospiraceae bacterium]|nr:DUF4250 domain-containing protein [Lachnospiraceae bacterium]
MELLQDPHMLVSVINMKLRDRYGTLEALCDDLELDRDQLVRKLREGGYEYNAERGQFA